MVSHAVSHQVVTLESLEQGVAKIHDIRSQQLSNSAKSFIQPRETGEVKGNKEKPHFRELLASEIEAANNFAHFLAQHSNDPLREGADWIPQWVQAH